MIDGTDFDGEDPRARRGPRVGAAGETIWVQADLFMTHDVFGPEVFRIFEREFGADAAAWDRDKVVVIPDHYIFTEDPLARRNIDVLAGFVEKHGITHFFAGHPDYKGVCHVTLASEGFNRPGGILFGTDSHTCTAGAFGMFATGIGNTDGAFVLGTGRQWLKVPETMRFDFDGSLPPYLMAKDLILRIIGDIGCDGAAYRAMEFGGDGIASLSMEERMTLCNMVIEAGGKNGIVAADSVTEAYMRGRGKAVGEFLSPIPTPTITAAAATSAPTPPRRRQAPQPGQLRGGAQPRRRRARPLLHRLLHRRQDRGFHRSRPHPGGTQGRDRHLRGASHDRRRARAGDRGGGRKAAARHLRRGRLPGRPAVLRRLPRRTARHLRPGA